MTNAINVICPYKYNGVWVFDDPARGLVREPFVAGADKMIDRVVADIPHAPSQQAPRRAAVSLGGADQGGELAVELRLFGEDPTQHAGDGHGWRLRAERTGLS